MDSRVKNSALSKMPFNAFPLKQNGGCKCKWRMQNLIIKHFVKDMGIALQDCESMGIRLKGLELANQFYQKAIDSGYQDKGTQALLKILRELNNLSKNQE